MKKILWDLFYAFARIGLFTFGGGYAMLALIQDECVERKQWITNEEMATVTAIAESTPGPIAINCATYTGYRQAGIPGAVAATVGVVLPSFVIIYLISTFFEHLLEVPLIANAFRGIKLAVGVLIVRAGVKMLKKMPRRPMTWIILIAACAAMLVINLFDLRFSTIWLILMAAVCGVAVYMAKGKGEHA